jgi:hypothetical protein
MPFYRITVTDIDGKIWQGIKEDPITDIDLYYNKARRQAISALKAKFRDIEVVMLTSVCQSVKEHIQKRNNAISASRVVNGGYSGKDKFAYRNLTEGKE